MRDASIQWNREFGRYRQVAAHCRRGHRCDWRRCLLLARVPFIGKLPGDISFQRDGFSFFFPVVACIILSIVLTIAINVAIRIFR